MRPFLPLAFLVLLADNTLAGQPVMVSFIRDGEIVYQT